MDWILNKIYIFDSNWCAVDTNSDVIDSFFRSDIFQEIALNRGQSHSFLNLGNKSYDRWKKWRKSGETWHGFVLKRRYHRILMKISQYKKLQLCYQKKNKINPASLFIFNRFIKILEINVSILIKKQDKKLIFGL